MTTIMMETTSTAARRSAVPPVPSVVPWPAVLSVARLARLSAVPSVQPAGRWPVRPSRATKKVAPVSVEPVEPLVVPWWEGRLPDLRERSSVVLSAREPDLFAAHVPAQRRTSTLLAFTGRLSPLIWSSPTDSTSPLSSTMPTARWLRRIWLAVAWLLRREAKITTFPMAP